MDFDDHSTTSEDSEPRVYKLLSETDIQVEQKLKLINLS